MKVVATTSLLLLIICAVSASNFVVDTKTRLTADKPIATVKPIQPFGLPFRPKCTRKTPTKESTKGDVPAVLTTKAAVKTTSTVDNKFGDISAFIGSSDMHVMHSNAEVIKSTQIRPKVSSALTMDSFP